MSDDMEVLGEGQGPGWTPLASWLATRLHARDAHHAESIHEGLSERQYEDLLQWLELGDKFVLECGERIVVDLAQINPPILTFFHHTEAEDTCVFDFDMRTGDIVERDEPWRWSPQGAEITVLNSDSPESRVLVLGDDLKERLGPLRTRMREALDGPPRRTEVSELLICLNDAMRAGLLLLDALPADAEAGGLASGDMD